MKLIDLLPEQARKRQIAISAGIVGVAVLASASIFATGPSATPQGNIEKAWPVSVVSAELKTLQPSFSAFGKLESNRVAHLRSDIVAKVVSVSVNEGEWVEAGELLIQLDDREAQLKLLERTAELKQSEANLASARSQLTLEQQNTEHFKSRFDVAQAKLERHRDLMRKRLISRALLDEVTAQTNDASIEYQDHVRQLINLPNQIAANEAHVAKAQALVEQAKLELERTSIRAPFAGPVIAVHTAPGDHSNLAAPLVDVADAKGFEVRVQIPDQHADAFQMALDQATIVHASSESGHQLTLRRLANHVRAGQTGLDAFFTFASAHTPALGRMFNITIDLPAQSQLIALPVQSLYENDKIYTVKDNRLVGHSVERVGETESDARGYEILVRAADIKTGTPIITTALPKAMTGLLVEVATEDS